MADPELKRNDNNANVREAQDLLNRSGAILDADGSFGPGTESAVREFQNGAGLVVTGVIDAATWQLLRALPEPSKDIPTRAVAFIGREEVGSRKLYDLSGSRPTWPGGASGVTIGVGYDLGYQKGFRTDWSDVLSINQISALSAWLGLKGDPAKPGPANLSGISIPWLAAWKVFIRKTLPEQVEATRTTFPRSNELPKICLGMLVSLVYNRGTSMTDSKAFPGNRKEMRDIQAAIRAGQFTKVPEALRAMKRLWPEVPGLQDRREREAAMFEAALTQR
jgi:GH24 family phage-related lysozyme (muramidase)